MEELVAEGEPSGSLPAPAEKLNDLSLDCSINPDDDINFTTSSDVSDNTAAPMRRSGSVSGSANLHQQMRRADGLAAQGRHAEALELLRPVLAKRPDDADALCLQGVCLVATGNKPQALAAYAGALASEPGHLKSLLGCAALHKDSGLLQEALTFLEKAHSILEKENCQTSPRRNPSPSTLDTLVGASAAAETAAIFEEEEEKQLQEQINQALAMVLTDLGTQTKLANGSNWKALYDRAVAVAPSYAPAHYNLGVAAAEQGDNEEALKRYQRAVELEPRYAEAWCNMGVIHRSSGRLEQAILAYDNALAAGPTLEMVQINLATALTEHGTALKNSGDLKGGIKAYERAVALRPRHAEALYNLGVAHAEAGDLDKAVFMYEMAIAAAPECAEAHNNLGVLHRERGNLEGAVKCYEAALTARPSFPQGLNNLAVVYTQQGRAAEALNMLHAALMAKPDYAEAHNNLGVLQRDVGDALAAEESYLRATELDPDNRHAGQNRLLALNYIHPGESELVCSAHAAWGERFQRLHPQLPQLSPQDFDLSLERPLIVGYISPDLFIHSVSYFAEAPLRHHNTSRVHHIVYNVCPKPDAKTERLKAAVALAGGLWRDAARLTEEELATAVRADKVDILVELTGHTANNRLGTMARRPAPVQVTWIGYPNSTGLKTIDYRFTDAVCDPLDTTQTFTEQLIRLSGCFLCYTPSHDAPPVTPLPALRNGFITFGSFNALAKQTPEVLTVWARILRTIPTARLVLKNKPFACEAVRQRYWSIFEAEGVTRDRIDLLPLAVATSDHLSQYGLMDICLDPWPYAGTTTTAEALFMGVPCLTRVGACHAHNVGASLLNAVGLAPEWVAGNEDEYVAKAQALSADVEALAELRAGLRTRMVNSNLCDAPRFVERLEDTYRELWQRWVAENSNKDESLDEE